MLDPIRTARVIGILVFFQGTVFLLFRKVMVWAITIGMERYSSFTGKMAKSLFSEDKNLVQLLQTSSNFLPILLALGSVACICGILIIAFPKQATRILIKLRVLK